MFLGIRQNWFVNFCEVSSCRQPHANSLSDIWAAYLTRQTTLIPTDFWIPSTYVTQEAIAPLQDRYSNKAIWIFARIINELSKLGQPGRESLVESRNRELSIDVLASLWTELHAWKSQCPVSVRPLIELAPSGGDAFPMILFGNQSASKFLSLPEQSSELIIHPVCGNIFYHTGCILLLENGLRKSRVDGDYMVCSFLVPRLVDSGVDVIKI